MGMLATNLDIPGWVQAVGVIAALYYTSRQSKRDATDSKEAADRHAKTEVATARRHRREMAERRLERLVVHYPKLVQRINAYVLNLAVAHDLKCEVHRLRTDDYEGNRRMIADLLDASRLRHQRAIDEKYEAFQVHMALRLDEVDSKVQALDLLMEEVAGWGLVVFPIEDSDLSSYAHLTYKKLIPADVAAHTAAGWEIVERVRQLVLKRSDRLRALRVRWEHDQSPQ